MKKDYIENMPAGNEIDKLIGEKVMGLCAHEWKFVPHDDDDGVYRICQKCHLEFWGLRPPTYGCHYGSYSTDIAAAWEVVEKLRMFVLPFGKTDWCSTNTRNFRGAFENIGVADTAPLAICRAALLATLKDLE